MKSNRMKYLRTIIMAAMFSVLLLSCIACSKQTKEDAKDVESNVKPLVIEKQEKQTEINADIDMITLRNQNGEVIYQCEAINDIHVYLKDKELEVIVPSYRCSCFDENGE